MPTRLSQEERRKRLEKIAGLLFGAKPDGSPRSGWMSALAGATGYSASYVSLIAKGQERITETFEQKVAKAARAYAKLLRDRAGNLEEIAQVIDDEYTAGLPPAVFHRAIEIAGGEMGGIYARAIKTGYFDLHPRIKEIIEQAYAEVQPAPEPEPEPEPVPAPAAAPEPEPAAEPEPENENDNWGPMP